MYEGVSEGWGESVSEMKLNENEMKISFLCHSAPGVRGEDKILENNGKSDLIKLVVCLSELFSWDHRAVHVRGNKIQIGNGGSGDIKTLKMNNFHLMYQKNFI